MHARDLETINDHHYSRRVLSVMLIGALGAGFLTWFMHTLILSSAQELDESSRAHIIEFVRLKRQESSASKDRRPSRPEVEEQPAAPVAPQMDNSQADNVLNVSETILPDGIGEGLSIGGLGFDASDGEYLPIVKIAPIYPHRAQLRGIEGNCVVMYTVTANGSVRDVKVVEHMCEEKIFWSSSIAAAKKFKYKPRIIDGEAIEVHRVTNRFIYDMPDEPER